MSSICEHCRFLGARNVCNNLKYHRNIHLRQIQIITDLVQCPQEIHWKNFHMEHDHAYFTLRRPNATQECSTTMRVHGQEIVKPEVEDAMDTPVNVKVENSDGAMGVSEEYALDAMVKIAEESENAIEIEKYEKSEPEEEIINDEMSTDTGSTTTHLERTGQSNWIQTRSLYEICEEMFAKHRSHKTLWCHECSQRVNLRDQRYGVNRFQNIIHHVCIHLNINIYFCLYCDFKFKSQLSIRYHLKKNHGRFWHSCHYVDMSSKYQEKIIKMMTECFGHYTDHIHVNQAGQEDVVLKKESDRIIEGHRFNTRALMELCQKICTVYLKNKVVDCRECLQPIPIIYRHRVDGLWSVIDHILLHLPIPMFNCQHCHFKFKSRLQVHDHLREAHDLSEMKIHYIDKTNSYQLDIMEMLEWCFCQNPYHAIRPKSLEPITNRGRPKKSLTESPLFNTCNEILAIHHSAGPISCQECATNINPFNSNQPEKGLELIVTHACIHLGIEIFLCRHCNSRFVSSIIMKIHLNENHGIKRITTIDFMDITNDYMDDIIKAIKWCFGQQSGQTDRPEFPMKTGTTKVMNRKMIPINNTNSITRPSIQDY